MDYPTSYSIKDTRDNLSKLVEQAALTGKSFTITKFGRPKALLTPITTKSSTAQVSKLNQALKDSQGIWANRQDIKDSAAWVDHLRQDQSYR